MVEQRGVWLDRRGGRRKKTVIRCSGLVQNSVSPAKPASSKVAGGLKCCSATGRSPVAVNVRANISQLLQLLHLERVTMLVHCAVGLRQ